MDEKHTKNDGKLPFIAGLPMKNIVIFHSYGLPEGNVLILVDLMEMNGISCDFNGAC